MTTLQTAPGAKFRVSLLGPATTQDLIDGGVDPTTVKWRLSNPDIGYIEMDENNKTQAFVEVGVKPAPFAAIFSAKTRDGKSLFGIFPLGAIDETAELIGLQVHGIAEDVPVIETVEETVVVEETAPDNGDDSTGVPSAQTSAAEPEETNDADEAPPVVTTPSLGEPAHAV